MEIIVLGGGVCGLAAGLLLARDGHRVTLLERDAAPPPVEGATAWDTWERGGVTQFRQAHFLQPRGSAWLDEELPDVYDAFLDYGAVVTSPIGDERFASASGRRPVLEAAFASAARAQPGLTVRRGVEVTAVGTGVVWAGEVLRTDLVLDAMGRGSRLPRLLGVDVPEEATDSGFIYYTRFFRGTELPDLGGGRMATIGSLTLITLPGDNGTWSVTVGTSAGDRALKRLRHEDVWTAAVRACPQQAHWLEGEPISGVMPMAGLLDRYRTPVPFPGVVSVGDACACTNPSLGRGMTLGLLHASALRDALRVAPRDIEAAFTAFTEREFAPWYRATVETDRARLAELEAIRLGQPLPEPRDAAGALRAALPKAMARDREALRWGLEIIGCLTLPTELFARPGVAARVLALAAEADGSGPAGPDRSELLSLVA